MRYQGKRNESINNIYDYITRTFQLSSKGKESKEISLSMILNEMTYLNIWNNFSKWVKEQTENKFVLNIYPLGIIRFIDDKFNHGINIKIADQLLSEFHLKWDDSRFNCERDVSPNQNMMKLNLLAIGANLNIPKIYINNGLHYLFKASCFLLSESKTCVIDLGILGNLYSKNGLVFHIPSNIKSVNLNNKKITIKTLLDKPSTILENRQKKLSKETKVGLSSRKENHKKDSEITLNNFQQFNIDSNDRYYNKDSINPKITKIPSNTLVKLSSDLKSAQKELQIPFPSNERRWKLQNMLGSTFKYKPVTRTTLAPIYFNVYSNTRAAPFTGEKTQIPICHRIGSFYSLSVQNLVIDRTTKSLKTLYDEYFSKNYTLNSEIPATEDEEYKYVIKEYDDYRKVELRKQIYKVYLNAIKHSVKDDYISEIKESWLVNIVKLCLRAYKLTDQKDYDDLLNECIKEILIDYKFSMKKSIIDYMLKHPEQREKLGVSIPFRKTKEYSEARISRPSDNNVNWKSNWNISKLKISSNLMIMSDNITKILKYYSQNLKNTLYLTIPSNYQTMSLSGFIEMQKNKLEEQRKIIGEDWKKYVENLLKENKIYKDQLFIYFKSVSGVMSTELRELITNSLKKFHNFISLFKKKSVDYKSAAEVFTEQFKSNFSFEQSFLEISVLDSKSGFHFSDDLKEIHTKIITLVQDVIKCSREVERPDNMFIKNLEKQANLWEVPINDPEICNMINQIDSTVKENIDIIEKVLDLYEQFKFVTNERDLLEHMKKTTAEHDKFAFNHVNVNILTKDTIDKKIALYEEKIKILREDYPNTLYMNMIKIDCSIVNNNLLKELNLCIDILLKYIFKENISNKSKLLNEEIEKLKEKLNSIANTEAELYNMEKEFEEDKQKKIPDLYNDYQDFLDWVFFYWKYDIYPKGAENIKGGGATDIISNLESIIKECNTNVSAIQNFITTFINHNLKEKKSAFENNLQKKRDNMNKEITELKKEWETTKQLASDAINQEETTFIEDLEIMKEKLEISFTRLEEMHEIENLLGTYNTDDNRLSQCLKELNPLLSLFNFIREMKNIQLANDKSKVKFIDFVPFNALVEKSSEIPELFRECNYIKKTKQNGVNKDIDNFRNSVEIGKAIYSLVEIVKIFEAINSEKISEDSKIILDENKTYCLEFTRIVFKNEKGQDFIRNIIFKQLMSSEVFDNFKSQKDKIEKLLDEWESIRNIFESVSKIAVDCDIEFVTCNFKDRYYVIVKHDNFVNIKSVLSRNLEELEKNLEGVEKFQYQSPTVEKLKKFKKNMKELEDIISTMEEQQLYLEKMMERSDIYQNTELLAKLKEVCL